MKMKRWIRWDRFDRREHQFKQMKLVQRTKYWQQTCLCICINTILFFSEKLRWMNRNSGGDAKFACCKCTEKLPLCQFDSRLNLLPAAGSNMKQGMCKQTNVGFHSAVLEAHSQKITWQLTGWGVKSPLLKTTAVLFVWRSLSTMEGAIRQRSPATFVAFYHCTSIYTLTQWLWFKVTATQ